MCPLLCIAGVLSPGPSPRLGLLCIAFVLIQGPRSATKTPQSGAVLKNTGGVNKHCCACCGRGIRLFVSFLLCRYVIEVPRPGGFSLNPLADRASILMAARGPAGPAKLLALALLGFLALGEMELSEQQLVGGAGSRLATSDCPPFTSLPEPLSDCRQCRCLWAACSGPKVAQAERTRGLQGLFRRACHMRAAFLPAADSSHQLVLCS